RLVLYSSDIHYIAFFICFVFFFFFFQAEDGIRDATVTGVQTCALPISRPVRRRTRERLVRVFSAERDELVLARDAGEHLSVRHRSEERRVGKECRSRWAPEEEKKNSRNRK